MSYSLQVRSGDLNPSGGQVATVSGVQKLVQDLRCMLLEPRGTDPLHPEYGSLLNGGIDEIGRTQPGVIGTTISSETMLGIESEIRRVVNQHMIDQQSQLFDEVNSYNGQTTLSNDEIIAAIDGIDATSIGDVVVVSVKLRTADNTILEIVRPVSG